MRSVWNADSSHRRSFFSQASAGMATFLVATGPTRGGANETIGVGLIGVGNRGGTHLQEILQLASSRNVRVTALCDVQRPVLSVRSAQVEKVQGAAPATTTRFRELLEDPDVDAVVIATPDFSHGTILNAALRAGKDVYIEKPMTIDLDSANEAIDLARSRDQIIQVGTQRRSDGWFRAGAEAVASGVLGDLSRISAAMNFNEPRWNRDSSFLRPEDVDWEAYRLDRLDSPFDPRRLVCWQLFRETSNGIPGLWMTHYADAVHMLTSATYPSSVVAHGGNYVWHDGREHADTFHALVEYPGGWLFDWGMGLGNAAGSHFTLHGREATLDADHWTIAREGAKGKTTSLSPKPTTSHIANWLDCVRSRQTPNAPIESGHQHAVATILAAKALETGRRVKYDPEHRAIQTT